MALHARCGPLSPDQSARCCLPYTYIYVCVCIGITRPRYVTLETFVELGDGNHLQRSR